MYIYVNIDSIVDITDQSKYEKYKILKFCIGDTTTRVKPRQFLSLFFSFSSLFMFHNISNLMYQNKSIRLFLPSKKN